NHEHEEQAKEDRSGGLGDVAEEGLERGRAAEGEMRADAEQDTRGQAGEHAHGQVAAHGARVWAARMGRAIAILSAMRAIAWLTLCAVAAGAGGVTVQTAASHPMRYHVSLPEDWSGERDWPVLVVIPDAGRDFAGNLQAFVRARGDRPYILVAPEVLTCGGAGSRTIDHYSYTPAVWDSLQHIDDFAFDEKGVGAVLADVRRRWHGESKAFLTGWEAGGHTVWALTFRRPELWRGVAPVTTNYQRRGLGPNSFSAAVERTQL